MMNPIKEFYKRRYIASLEETLAKLKSGEASFVEFKRSEDYTFSSTTITYKLETVEFMGGNS